MVVHLFCRAAYNSPVVSRVEFQARLVDGLVLFQQIQFQVHLYLTGDRGTILPIIKLFLRLALRRHRLQLLLGRLGEHVLYRGVILIRLSRRRDNIQVQVLVVEGQEGFFVFE